MTSENERPESSDFARDVLRENRGLVPSPLGAFDALDQTGSIATPLMAGFALTTALLVLTTTAATFRWPNLALLLLTISVVLLVMSVQAAQWARSFRVHPGEVQHWWPNMTPGDRAMWQQEVARHHEARALWSSVQRWTYRPGLLALLAGLTVALVPPVPGPGAPSISQVRWAAVGVSCCGVLLEAIWIGMSIVTGKWGAKFDNRDGWIHRAFKVPIPDPVLEPTT